MQSPSRVPGTEWGLANASCGGCSRVGQQQTVTVTPASRRSGLGHSSRCGGNFLPLFVCSDGAFIMVMDHFKMQSPF